MPVALSKFPLKGSRSSPNREHRPVPRCTVIEGKRRLSNRHPTRQKRQISAGYPCLVVRVALVSLEPLSSRSDSWSGWVQRPWLVISTRRSGHDDVSCIKDASMDTVAPFSSVLLEISVPPSVTINRDWYLLAWYGGSRRMFSVTMPRAGNGIGIGAVGC
jgi:hypothetical protein